MLPALWCFRRDEVQKDPEAAAEYSANVLELMLRAAKEEEVHLCFSLVEKSEGKLFHTAYLLGPRGVVGSYRKAHLGRGEAWASPGACLCPVLQVAELGRVAMMLDFEVWIPEVARALSLAGAEIILHPADWDRQEAPDLACTQRAGENRVNLVSVTRLDCPGHTGSQTTFTPEFTNTEPIPLMRYARGAWARHGVEEQIPVDLPRRMAHCKMMGFHLDVLRKRFPECYSSFTLPTEKLPYRA